MSEGAPRWDMARSLTRSDAPSARELLATGGRRSLGPSAWGRSPRRVRSEEGGRILIKIFPFSDPTALRAYLRAPALWLARRSMAMASRNSVVLSLLHTANEGRRGPTERNTVCGHCTAVPKLAVDTSHSTRTRLERRDDRSGSTSRQQQHSSHSYALCLQHSLALQDWQS